MKLSEAMKKFFFQDIIKPGRLIKSIPAAALIAIATVPAVAAEEMRQKILERLEDLQNQVAEQQAEINSLKARLAKAEETGIRSETDRDSDNPSLAQVTIVGPVTVYRPHVEAIEILGDLEFGYLRDRLRTAGEGSEKASSFYTSFRLGAIWQTHESWEAGAGLVTSGYTADPRSTRQAWSRRYPFAAGDIALDYAYVQHRLDEARLTLGQQHNPFLSSCVLWDRDVRPIGVTAQYSFEDLFATAGWYKLLNRGLYDERDLQMWAGQVGYAADLRDFDFTVAAAYYRTSSNFGEIVTRDPAARMNTADLLLEVGTSIADLRLLAQGQIWRNFSARRGRNTQVMREIADPATGRTGLEPRGDIDPKDNDTGFSLGVSGDWAGFRLGYSYIRVEADSFAEVLIDELTAVNNHVNLKGHKIGMGYRITEHLGINCAYRRLIEIRGSDKADVYQFDVRYKF